MSRTSRAHRRGRRELRDAAPTWTAMGVDERIELLDELERTILEAAEGWTTAAAQAKGIRRTVPRWRRTGARGARDAAQRHAARLDAARHPRHRTARAAGDPHRRARTHRRRRVPDRAARPVLFPGFTAEVRLAPGVTPEQARERMGRIYHEGHVSTPEVALVLGAGNVSSIGPMDALTQLFAEDRVVLLKLNPVNEYLAPHLDVALRPLIRGGWLRIVTGGPDVAAGDRRPPRHRHGAPHRLRPDLRRDRVRRRR
jgi:hypothetical protein